jgi:hypothetical protein
MSFHLLLFYLTSAAARRRASLRRRGGVCFAAATDRGTRHRPSGMFARDQLLWDAMTLIALLPIDKRLQIIAHFQ